MNNIKIITYRNSGIQIKTNTNINTVTEICLFLLTSSTNLSQIKQRPPKMAKGPFLNGRSLFELWIKIKHT